MSADQVRIHIWIKGRVQGVGFRAFTGSMAARLDLAGWTRNLGYDEVEIVIEGSRKQTGLMLEAVKQGPRSARVDQCRVEEEPYIGEFSGFEIRSSH